MKIKGVIEDLKVKKFKKRRKKSHKIIKKMKFALKITSFL